MFGLIVTTYEPLSVCGVAKRMLNTRSDPATTWIVNGPGTGPIGPTSERMSLGMKLPTRMSRSKVTWTPVTSVFSARFSPSVCCGIGLPLASRAAVLMMLGPGMMIGSVVGS